MSAIPFKFPGSSLWLLAAVIVSALEIVAAGGRSFSSLTHSPAPDPNDFLNTARDSAEFESEIGCIGASSQGSHSEILVVGNLEAASAGELEVTLLAVKLLPAPKMPVAAIRPDCRSHDPGLTGQRQPPNSSSSRRSQATWDAPPHPAANRIYFLQSAISMAGNESGHSPISCRLDLENSRIRIYVDERLPSDQRLSNLMNSISEASESRLGDVVEEIVGPVEDVDRDGHLAVVITSEIARLGGGRTPVDGLTRPADFLRGVDRPLGNSSDVIFLSSHLEPGDQMRAVLAHEWCHASIFSRRGGDLSDQSKRPADDDWLNEAIAHVVEQQASGSLSNLSHRIHSYLSQPGTSPLVVRDYYQPNFWRHDGCRGAAYLFLCWCRDHTENELLKHLIASQSLDVASLESATGLRFEELFRGWTAGMGQALANVDEGHVDAKNRGSTGDGTRSASAPDGHPACRTWRLDECGERTLTIRIRGTCAEFVRIVNPGDCVWRLTATCDSDRLQTTLIPTAH